MLRRYSYILAALVGSASVAIAQGPPGGGGGRGMRPAVAILLEAKDSIPLTAEQVTKFEEIRKAAEAKNAPLMDKMRATREAGGSMEEMRPIMGEVRKNDEESYQAALALLTPEQKPKAEAVVTKAREAMRRRPPQ
jgi:Spy/CpxP family protein refolding chaperone